MLNYTEDYTTPRPPLYPVTTTTKTKTTKIETSIIPIESRKERHLQKQAEEGAFGTQDEHILMSLFFCETCQVGIGPDHVEQELWLYHAKQATIRVNEIPLYFEDAYLRICGGCAKRYHLPEEHCLVQPEYWLTTILLEQDETRIRQANPHDEQEWGAIRRAIDQVVKAGTKAIMTSNKVHSLQQPTIMRKKREHHDHLSPRATTAR